MKKVSLFMLPFMAAALVFTGCKDNVTPDGGEDDTVKPVATVTRSALIDAVSDLYAEWETTATTPAELSVSGTALTVPQYQQAMAQLLLNIKDGNTGDIEVLNYRAADHPERDSYDAEEIAVFNGPANEGETEDLANVATRMLAAMTANGQVPNQTIFYREGTALAFSTDRATVCFARAISEYAEAGSMPAKVVTEYLAPAPTIKAFATEYVKILDVWQNTVGTCNYVTGIGATTEAEFVEFDQPDAHYVPDDHTITVGGNVYDKADMFEIALRSYLLLRGYDGTKTDAVGAAAFAELAVTPVTMDEKVPDTHDYYWTNPYSADDKYSSYNESAGNGGELRTTDGKELVKMDILDNFAFRAVNFRSGSPISNNCGYGKGQVSGYSGVFSSQRALLTFAHFFKYVLDNNLTNLSTISADQTFTTVLFYPEGYRESLIKLTVDKETLSFEAAASNQTVSITSKESDWNAVSDESWVSITPNSGSASENAQSVTISVTQNTGAARSAKLTVTAGGEEVTIAVSQKGVPGAYTIKDFATEYVKLLDVWTKTTGNVSYTEGPVETLATATAGVEGAHYIPLETTITVAGTELTTANVFEMALRSYLLLRGYDGTNTTASGAGNFTTVTAWKMSSTVPTIGNYNWGPSPWNESGSTAVGGVTTGNGGGLRMGDPAVGTEGGQELVKMDILDNFAMRAVNYGGGTITNMCGYMNNRLDGYFGCFCSHRALVTYAQFFKYLLDNNVDDLSTVSADQTFESHNLQ